MGSRQGSQARAVVEMRASHIRSNLEEINRMSEPERSAIRAKIGPHRLEQIANSASVAWLPVECDMDLTLAVVSTLGPAGNRRWSRDAMLRSASGPLIKPMLDGARSVFGVTPHALFKILPRGFGLIYRGAGELRYEPLGPDRALVLHEVIPEQLLEAPWYLEGIAGALEALAVVLGGTSEVTMRIDAATHTARYEASWRGITVAQRRDAV